MNIVYEAYYQCNNWDIYGTLTKNTMPEDVDQPKIPAELSQQFVKGSTTAEADEAVMREFKKAVIERALGVEMSYLLGYGPGSTNPSEATHLRNGGSDKIVLTDDGVLRIAVPRA